MKYTRPTRTAARPNRPTLALLAAAGLAAGCNDAASAASEAEAARETASKAQEALELAELARAIEVEVAALRGREFKYPVPVEVADVEAFRAYATERMESIGDERQREAQELIAKLLGLIPAEMDYWGETIAILGGQVGGYYDPDRDTFSIMEGVSGPLARSILAHELVHALDDQYFDLGAELEARADDTDRLAAYHAVVEGSAMIVQGAWTMKHIGEFSPEDIEAMSDVTPDELFEAPAYVWLPVLFSYFRGQSFLQRTDSLMAAQTRRYVIDEIDKAFETPPRSTEQILHPEKYWDPEQVDEPVTVRIEVANAESGWEPLHAEVLGELGLYLVADGDLIEAPNLSNPMSLLGLEFTSESAEGWEGDCAQLFANGRKRLLMLATVWETEADRDEFASAVGGRRAELGEVARKLAGDLGLGVHSVATQPEGDLEFRLVIGLGVGTEDTVGANLRVVVGD